LLFLPLLCFLFPAIAGIADVMAIIIMAAITLFSQLVLTIVFFIFKSPIL